MSLINSYEQTGANPLTRCSQSQVRVYVQVCWAHIPCCVTFTYIMLYTTLGKSGTEGTICNVQPEFEPISKNKGGSITMVTAVSTILLCWAAILRR